MVGYGKEKALDTERDHQNPCCYGERHGSLTRLLQPSSGTHIKHSVCKWKSSILQIIINSYRICADLSLSFGMSYLIFVHSSVFTKNVQLKEKTQEFIYKTTRCDSCDVSSLGLVNRYHLLTQWQVQEHRQKEKLVHLCSTILSALETNSGIRGSELELLKQSSPKGQLNIFQVLTTGKALHRQLTFVQAKSIFHPTFSFSYSEFPQYVQLPYPHDRGTTLFIPSLDSHCTSRYKQGSASGSSQPMVRLIKHSLDWGPTALYPVWYKAQIRKPKKICVVCVFKLNNEELDLLLKERLFYS